jgi:membrane-bound ClpP family serine protease
MAASTCLPRVASQSRDGQLHQTGHWRANDGHAGVVVIKLDTAGGFDSSMRDIVQAIEKSGVPVIVNVSSTGARAASAGTFITLAGNIAAMAPNMAIGATHPVDSQPWRHNGNTRHEGRERRSGLHPWDR